MLIVVDITYSYDHCNYKVQAQIPLGYLSILLFSVSVI